MNILISNALQSTQIFLALFFIALAISFRKKTTKEIFSTSLTQELKGVAMLAIVFAHIGLYLVSDTRFLFPLSIAAGVGVDMFLFLSGYGLVASSLKKPYSLKEFYLRRLPKLYVPFWVTSIAFLFLDFFISHKTYGVTYVWHTLLGFFPRADIALDLNSPLWYFSFIIFYYLLFPLVFSKRYPWISALILYAAGYFLLQWDPTLLSQVMRLYRVHILAFPLGVLIGSMPAWSSLDRLKGFVPTFSGGIFLRRAVYWLVTIFLAWFIGYTAYFAHFGDERWIIEVTSVMTMTAVIFLFMLKKLESRLLYLFGFYSYEIYLLHWPILSRFDIFYKYIPAWLATVAYLLSFIGLSWLLRQLANKLFSLGAPGGNLVK